MAQPTHQQLLDENRPLRGQNAQLRQQLAHTEAPLRQLTSQSQEALRATKRQAAPFSKGPPKANPEPPGRKAGAHYGPKAHRPIPTRPPDEVMDVPLPDGCPYRGGLIDEDRRDDGQLSPPGVAVGRLEARLDRMLCWTRTHPDNERRDKHLDKHRGELFTFLKAPGIDATNYRAEQAMRPAAVNREVWGGNRTIAMLASILCGRRVCLALLPAEP